MRAEHETEETLNAWLDNELTSRENALVGAHVEHCSTCATALANCRETRATVSMLLQGFDRSLESVPSRRGAPRLKLESTSASSSPPIISHIVAGSKPMNLWLTAKHFLPVAAAAAVFVGSTTYAIMRNFDVLSGSVNSVASTAQVPFVDVTGIVVRPEGTPIANASVWIEDRKQVVHSDANGNFSMLRVPRQTRALHARGIGFSEATIPFVPEKASSMVVTLIPDVHRLNPVKIQADSLSATPPNP